MPKWLKKTLDVISTVGLVIVVLIAILLVGVRIFGIEPNIVLSGSMEPEIYTGSLVYVKKISPEEAQELQVGDTVTYQVDAQGTKVTHKIYNVVGPIPNYATDSEGNTLLDESGAPVVSSYATDKSGNKIVMYTTYGINNVRDGNIENALDGDPKKGNLASSNVIGKPVFSIPLMGYIAFYVQTPPGRVVAYGVCLLLLVMAFFSGPSDKKKKKGAKENVNAAEESADAPPELTEEAVEGPQTATETTENGGGESPNE